LLDHFVTIAVFVLTNLQKAVILDGSWKLLDHFVTIAVFVLTNLQKAVILDGSWKVLAARPPSFTWWAF
jgi:hypothetical protein